ncbi:hypothetical protein DdX_13963 [Ditylenchus destructor]|uniref:Uncharacterized protein n=1 Tax=Ditylenchus destructor TaxID=166010 RepID=A0AAD4MSM4_9BILA|nr:hypothetical protein DdX_13963 [Ditylenchus destructor]
MAKNTSGELGSKATQGTLFDCATADSSHHQSIMTQCRAVCLALSPEPSAAPKHNNTGIGTQNSAQPDSLQKMLGPKSHSKNGLDSRCPDYTYVKIVEDSKADALEFEFVPGTSTPSTNSPHIPATKPINMGIQNGLRQVKKAVPRGLKKHIVRSSEISNGREFRRKGDEFEVMTLPSPAMLNNQLISVVDFKGWFAF